MCVPYEGSLTVTDLRLPGRRQEPVSESGRGFLNSGRVGMSFRRSGRLTADIKETTGS